MRGRNQAREGKVLQPNIDQPPTALYARPRKEEGHVTSRKDNICTAALTL